MARRSNAARRDASAARRREGIRSQPLRRAAAIALLAAACLHPRPEAPPLRVGTSGDYPPFSLVRDGRLEGLDVEIARRFAHDGGRRLELVPFRWPELTRDLAAGRFDLAMGGVTPPPQRAVAGPFTRDRKGYLGRDPALVAELDAWLRAREADGTLAALRARWLGPERARARSAFASDLDALVALVDLRLAFMPAVAAAKQKTGRSVEDPGQEARVLAAVRARAAERGLSPAAVEALFRAQIEAARDLEKEFLAHPEEVDTLDLEREARPPLARISELIVARAADLAADPGPLAALDPGRVAETLDGSLTRAMHRRAIASAIAHLTASPITRREKTGVCQRRITSLEAGRQRPLIADPDEKSRANPETSAVSVR